MPSELSPEFFAVLTSLAKLVIFAMLLERALVLIFDYRWYKAKLDGLGLKVPIAFLVSWFVCTYYGFDVLSALFEPDKPTPMGLFLTAAIAAGGSAGAITLFQGVFKFSKESQESLRKLQKAEAEATLVEAETRKKKAKAAAEVALAEAETLKKKAKMEVAAMTF